MAQEGERPAGWLRGRGSALLVLLFGTSLSVALFAMAARDACRHVDERFRHHSADLAPALSSAFKSQLAGDRGRGAVLRSRRT